MELLRKIDNAQRHILNVALSISGICMLLMAFVSTADVVTYLVLGKPFPGANESVEAALCVCVAMTIANAQYRRDHIMVDILVQKFSARGRIISDFGALLVGLFCMVLLSMRAWELAVESFNQRETAFTLYSFPIYPWKILYAAGFSLTAVEFARQLIWMMLGDPNGGAWSGERDDIERSVE